MGMSVPRTCKFQEKALPFMFVDPSRGRLGAGEQPLGSRRSGLAGCGAFIFPELVPVADLQESNRDPALHSKLRHIRISESLGPHKHL